MKKKYSIFIGSLLVFIFVILYSFYIKGKNDFKKAEKFEARAYYPEALTFYFKVIKNLFANKNLKEESLAKIAFITDEKISDKKKAAEYFEKYFIKYPEGKYLEECMYRIGYNNLLFTGNLEKALLFFEKFTIKFPNSKYIGPVYTMLGDTYKKKHEYKKTIENNLKAVEKNLPGLDSDYLHLVNAEMYYRMGNNSAGISEIEKIKNPKSNLVRYNIFYNLYLTMKYPRSYSKFVGLAEAYKKNGLPEKAKEIMKTISGLKK